MSRKFNLKKGRFFGVVTKERKRRKREKKEMGKERETERRKGGGEKREGTGRRRRRREKRRKERKKNTRDTSGDRYANVYATQLASSSGGVRMRMRKEEVSLKSQY